VTEAVSPSESTMLPRVSFRLRLLDVGRELLPFAVGIAVWQVLSSLNIWPPVLFPSPVSVFWAFAADIKSGALPKAMSVSLVSLAYGFLIGAAVALPLGYLMGLNRASRNFFDPLVNLLQAIPGLAWIPFAILWFGLGQGAVIFIIVMSVFFPVLHNLLTGIRLVQPTTVGANPLWIQDLILIQQPDDLTGGTPGDPRAAMLNCPASSVPDQDRNALGLRKLGQVVNFTNVNFTPNGGGPRALVQQGDWLEVNGGGLPHRILNASASTLMLQLASDASCYVGSDPTTNFRIIRGPRALIGEVPIHLKHDIAIDLTPYSVGNPTSQNYRVDLFTNPPNIDILFSPGGAVLATGNSVPSPAAPGDSNVYLYLRDTTETNHFYGEPLVVTVFSRSGFVKTSPVAFPPAPDPLTFAKDARGSGQ